MTNQNIISAVQSNPHYYRSTSTNYDLRGKKIMASTANTVSASSQSNTDAHTVLQTHTYSHSNTLPVAVAENR